MVWVKSDISRHFNKQLILSCTLIALSSFNYAFDNQGYATTQAMDAFIRQFGDYNPTTKKYALGVRWLSFFNGFPYLAFACGMQPLYPGKK
jgi:SP family sugar:H+ symporter-like MFS transporter